MGGKSARKKKERNNQILRSFGVVCSNCGEKTRKGHFVPPSFGEPGFFTCTEIRHIGMVNALCDGRKKANLREDLEVDRYEQLGHQERFQGEDPYKICPKCIDIVRKQNTVEI